MRRPHRLVQADWLARIGRLLAPARQHGLRIGFALAGPPLLISATKRTGTAGVQGFILPKKKPRGVSGGARFSFLSKEVTANTVTGDRELLLLLDLDLIVFVVIFLLASKSCTWPFLLPTAVTLRLGKVLKAIPVPRYREGPCGLARIVAESIEMPILGRFCKKFRRFSSLLHHLLY
jgi:hypothetical protein